MKRCVTTGLLLFVTVAGLTANQSSRKPPVLYQDKSWTHIGDGNFSPESNAASDLTTKLAGKVMTLKLQLKKEQIAAVKNERWKSAVLSGIVVGNDAGRLGQTKASIVDLGGKKIGELTKSGKFKIVFDKKLLLADPSKPIEIHITAGRNTAEDVDDQELGQFVLQLSEQAPPQEVKKKE